MNITKDTKDTFVIDECYCIERSLRGVGTEWWDGSTFTCAPWFVVYRDSGDAERVVRNLKKKGWKGILEVVVFTGFTSEDGGG